MDETLEQGTVQSIGLTKPVRKRKLRPAPMVGMQEEEGMAGTNRLAEMAQQRPMLGMDPMVLKQLQDPTRMRY